MMRCETNKTRPRHVVVDFGSVPDLCKECAYRQWGLPLRKRLIYMRHDDERFPCEILTARIYESADTMVDLLVRYSDETGEHTSLVCSTFLGEMNTPRFSRKRIVVGRDW